MPTPTKGPRLGGSPAHERLILANLAQSLFEHGKITTTLAKAKRLRPVAEKLITSAKRGTLHARRNVLKSIHDKDVVHKLFAEIGPSFATREGGYTRITKTMPRKGDNAPMAVIELIGEETVSSAASRVARVAASRKAASKTPSPAPKADEVSVGDADKDVVDKDAAAEASVGDAGDGETAAADSAATDAADEGASETDASAKDATVSEEAAEDAPADAADTEADEEPGDEDK